MSASYDYSLNYVALLNYTAGCSFFNRANDNTLWVRVKNGLNPSDLGQVLKKDFSTIFDGIYTIGTNPTEHKGYLKGVLKEDYVFTAVESKDLPEQIVLDKGNKLDDETASEYNETYYVKLEAYALTNLSKHIYGVRHKTADWKNISALGKLAHLTDYIVDPLSKEKNSAINANDWKDDEKDGDYFFYNDFLQL